MSWEYTYDKERGDVVDEAKCLARHISDYLNVMSSGRPKVLVTALSNTHRTLQQDFMRVVVEWIKYNAETKFYDGRNQAAVLLSRKLQKTIDEAPSGGYLPLV